MNTFETKFQTQIRLILCCFKQVVEITALSFTVLNNCVLFQHTSYTLEYVVDTLFARKKLSEP